MNRKSQWTGKFKGRIELLFVTQTKEKTPKNQGRGEKTYL